MKRIIIASISITIIAMSCIIVYVVTHGFVRDEKETFPKTEVYSNSNMMKESGSNEEKVRLIGEDDAGDIPVEPIEGNISGDYVEYTEPKYRTHPITGDILDTETGEIITTNIGGRQ